MSTILSSGHIVTPPRKARIRLTVVQCAVLGALCSALFAEAAKSLQSDVIALADRRVHISQAGEASPIVVFEAGLGEDLTTWSTVLQAVSPFARTFAYDRPGLGTSDPAPVRRDLPTMAEHLHSVLVAAKVPPPYILVGHSLGGALVQLFAHRYPSDVLGLVLVDPEDGRLDERLRAAMSKPDWKSRQDAIDKALPQMPAAVRAELEAYRRSASFSDSAYAFPQMPVVVLTGTRKNPEFPGNPLEQDIKLQMHRALLARLTSGEHVLVPSSRHYIQRDAPDQVVSAIRSVIRRAGPATTMSSPHRH